MQREYQENTEDWPCKFFIPGNSASNRSMHSPKLLQSGGWISSMEILIDPDSEFLSAYISLETGLQSK